MPLPDLDNATILVTGGTGSFGEWFVVTVLERHPLSQVIVFSRDETRQQEMRSALNPGAENRARFIVGDVRDQGSVEKAMDGADCVIHAAALKHGPAAEKDPSECVRTNILGSENVIRAALRVGVRRVMSLSTDNAVHPISIYGASKLIADRMFLTANGESGDGDTDFAVVRYGNILGSSGSVVQFFRELIASGADSLPLTDARMSRFWITLRQSVDFLLTSLAAMHGGEIFVPKSPAAKVADLARALAPGLPHRIVGMRKGEKLHSVLLTEEEASDAVELDNRYVVLPSPGRKAAFLSGAVGGCPLPARFACSSRDSANALGVEGLRTLLNCVEG